MRYYGELKGITDTILEEPPYTGPAPVLGEHVIIGDYEYVYGQGYRPNGSWVASGYDGWGVRVLDKGKHTYEPLQKSIKGCPIVSLDATYMGCSQMSEVPVVPVIVKTMRWTYQSTGLLATPTLPVEVVNLINTFSGCKALTSVTVMPSKVLDMVAKIVENHKKE